MFPNDSQLTFICTKLLLAADVVFTLHEWELPTEGKVLLLSVGRAHIWLKTKMGHNHI